MPYTEKLNSDRVNRPNIKAVSQEFQRRPGGGSVAATRTAAVLQVTERRVELSKIEASAGSSCRIQSPSYLPMEPTITPTGRSNCPYP